MLSHHAPPKRLLQNFQRTALAGEKPSLWVYSRRRVPRQVFKIRAESAENGYFLGDPQGRSEDELEHFLNESYEGPFNRILPALCADLIRFFDDELTGVCANYLANLFHRSKPKREANKEHSIVFNRRLHERLADPLTLKRYAASISLRTGRPVGLESLFEASRNFLNDESQSDEAFFQSATTDFSQLPQSLASAHWAVCHSPELDLVQSDAAIALLNRSSVQEDQVTYGFGILRTGSEWYLPISPAFALRVSQSYIANRRLSMRTADQINEYLVRAAYESVYSSSYRSEIETFTREHIYSLRVFRDVLRSDLDAAVDDLLSKILS